MELTAENYYSPEANAEYMSVSQFKSFAGTEWLNFVENGK